MVSIERLDLCKVEFVCCVPCLSPLPCIILYLFVLSQRKEWEGVQKSVRDAKLWHGS